MRPQTMANYGNSPIAGRQARKPSEIIDGRVLRPPNHAGHDEDCAALAVGAAL